MTDTEIAAMRKFTSAVRSAHADFVGVGLDYARWAEFFEAKQAAYAEFGEVAPAIKEIPEFWRIVQSTPSEYWMASVAAALKRVEKRRVCADCGDKISNGSRCTKCATAKKETAKTARKKSRKLKRRVKQLTKKAK